MPCSVEGEQRRKMKMRETPPPPLHALGPRLGTAGLFAWSCHIRAHKNLPLACGSYYPAYFSFTPQDHNLAVFSSLKFLSSCLQSSLIFFSNCRLSHAQWLSSCFFLTTGKMELQRSFSMILSGETRLRLHI